MSVTRAHLIEAVEAGIESASAIYRMSDPSAAKLRHVARTADRVCAGRFWDDATACGCPLVQAGLRTPSGVQPPEIDNADAAWFFAGRFDVAMGCGPCVVAVVG